MAREVFIGECHWIDFNCTILKKVKKINLIDEEDKYLPVTLNFEERKLW